MSLSPRSVQSRPPTSINIVVFPVHQRRRLRPTNIATAGGLRAILSDPNKLVVAVGGVTALAARIFMRRELIIAFVALEKENVVFSSMLEDIYIYSWGSEVYKLEVLGYCSSVQEVHEEVQGKSARLSRIKVLGTTACQSSSTTWRKDSISAASFLRCNEMRKSPVGSEDAAEIESFLQVVDKLWQAVVPRTLQRKTNLIS
ncbi:hypothetical protein Vadar_021542 [Vaccinium darrowii]|uniref:Uncharacterized protein n=1 Tax=Vaccinium darrowii TaxID=229202 RepID=A0ACB7XJ21_9ERIC|nr:hypothetical protein Vadar_021542 [Vaccinium darrowii]